MLILVANRNPDDPSASPNPICMRTKGGVAYVLFATQADADLYLSTLPPEYSAKPIESFIARSSTAYLSSEIDGGPEIDRAVVLVPAPPSTARRRPVDRELSL